MIGSGQARGWGALRAVCLAMVLGLALVALGGCGDDGGGDDGGEVQAKPIHGIASVLVTETNTGPQVQARLWVISTEGGETRFVEDATDTTVTFGGETLELAAQRVTLGTTDQETRVYKVTSQSASSLVYTPGETYTFTFKVSGDAAGDLSGQTFTMAVVAPSDQTALSAASEPGRETDLDVVPNPTFGAGILEVVRTASSETTYISYPFSEVHLESVDTLLNSTVELRKINGGVLTVPGAAFNRQGTHTITYTGVESNSTGGEGMSTNLGVFSVAYAGVAAELQVDIP